MKDRAEKSSFQRVIVVLLMAGAIGVASVWGFANWLDAPDPAPKVRPPQQQIELTPAYQWCVKAALGQLITYSAAAVVAAGCWLVARQKQAACSWGWTIYLASWFAYAIYSSYDRYARFGRGVYPLSLHGAPLMSSEALGELVLFFLFWIAVPLLFYSLGLLGILARVCVGWGRSREFRLFIYVTAIVLLLNGLYLEPSTWRVPRGGGGMENALGPFGVYLSYVVGWHLRNHLLLLVTFMAIIMYFNAANKVPLAEPIQDSLLDHDDSIRPDDGNPYRYQ